MAATKTSDETLQATIAGAHMRGANATPLDRKFPGYAFWGEKGADVASAATLTLGDDGDYFHITGSTGPITDIDFTTAKDGRRATLIFDSTPTINHNATTLKLPGGANITAAAGDRMIVRQDSGDNVIVEDYIKANGTPVAFSAASQSDQETATSNAVAVTPGTQQFHPSAAKVWANVAVTGATINASYNVTSWTDSGAGDGTLNVATDFSSANWVAVFGPAANVAGVASGSTSRALGVDGQAAGTLDCICFRTDTGAVLADPSRVWNIAGFGDQ